MKKPIIEIKNLSKNFKKKKVLVNINLKIYQGERFGLLGPNGAGKTTLIQILLGTITPDKGEIKIFGKDLEKNLTWIQQRVNAVFSFSNLQEQITPMENLITFARLYGVKNPRKKAESLLKFFGLKNFITSNIKTEKLSSGEMARLLLCKAFVNNPKILFLDEPTSSLDPKMTLKVQDYILNLHQKNNLALFYVSHNLEEAKKICTKIAFLKRGKIIKKIDAKNIKNVLKFY